MSRLPKKGDNRPVAVSDNNRPVIASDNRPVAVSDNNRPVAVSDNNRPVAVSDDNRPVIARDDNRSVVASEKLFVCAIDFGTTYSGYAYSTRQDPIKIYCPHWHSGSSTLISYKTPTTVLLDERKKFLAFGYEAEKKFLELAENDAADDFFYFRRFKMILYDKLRSGVEVCFHAIYKYQRINYIICSVNLLENSLIDTKPLILFKPNFVYIFTFLKVVL